MIEIVKGHEPAEWVKERQTPGITFEAARKDALRQALWCEQGGICGYCMRRIPSHSSGITDTRIEHLKPRTLSIREGKPEETLAYSNMILCCNGDIDNNGNYHCDRSKDEKPISFKPFDSVVIDTISYSSKDGSIRSRNVQYDKDFNDVLNLNHPRLKANRLAVIKAVIIEMGKKTWKKSEVEHKLKHYSDKTSMGTYHEYCGIVTWYLTKKLKMCG